MSINSFFKKSSLAFLIPAVAVVGLGAGWFFHQSGSSDSTMDSGEHSFSSFSPEKDFKSNSKTGSPISTELKVVGGVPSSNEQELRLRLRARVNVPFSGELHYKWTIHDAKLVDGEEEGEWVDVQPNQEVSKEIVLLNASKEEPRIILVDVYYTNDKNRLIQSTAVFSTRGSLTAGADDTGASAQKAQPFVAPAKSQENPRTSSLKIHE